jgi:Protein of unknown function (DUF2971)
MGEIYHYTDANALLNILQNQTLWATHILHLNDPNEYVSPRVIADGIMQEIGLTVKKLEHRDLSYVTCFSRKRDDLNQFRSYADDGKGYLVSFDETMLIESFELSESLRRNIQLSEIVYGVENYATYLRQVVVQEKENFETEIAEYTARGQPFSGASGRIYDGFYKPELMINTAVYCCKSKHYAEEDEIRLVARANHRNEHGEDLFTNIKYRSRNGKIIPFIELKAQTGVLLPIKEIIIGPAHDRASVEVLKDVISNLCADSRYTRENQIRITASEIDYRSSR